MTPPREISYAAAIREAFATCLARDPSVVLMGLGVSDPKGFFGTTINLHLEFGEDRVMDMPCAEAGMTGVALGAAVNGMRPVINHQRLDFALLSMDQLCTQAAKWRYMFGGKERVPLVMRAIIGRGWGQGPQHSQSLQSWFAHIPGLKVVMPATPHDAKGMLIAAIEDDDPVVFLEHRWLHHLTGPVPEGHYTVPLGPTRTARSGDKVTIAAMSYMVIEALEAADRLAAEGIEAEVIDVRCLRPLDRESLIQSIWRTGRLVVADGAWASAGMSAELIASISESAFGALKAAPKRVCLPDCPTPTSPSLAADYYPRAGHIAAAVREVLDLPPNDADLLVPAGVELDKPNPAFTGPF
ncbi:alpha-ketoacid dehydrogenase subunit beta [Actomonas aquatica]|uniref:Transketolase C-terminal domain-containing protein n=1 Tax=Actomonas aquatica TaxID=2866162 RepID=A0ABZ1CFF9_9BACT|nr:transketolase C-terminal domain-containing protein [Opitutus sp. WL0086]WRQ89319.1 transketolase C-terminal domain-containing protein [Opitutus sp. WL0086]